MHIRQLQPRMILLLPGEQSLSWSKGRILIWFECQKLIKQLMLNRGAFGAGVGNDILVSHIVQTRNSIQSSSVVLIAKKSDCFSLGFLTNKKRDNQHVVTEQ